MTVVSVFRTRSVSAPPAAVWATLAEFARISDWAPNVDHSCLMSDQTEGVGTVRRIQSNRLTVVETVEIWEPQAILSYRITGLPPVIKRVTNTWRLIEAGSGTNVSLTTEVDAGPRPPQKVIAKAVAKRLTTASDQMLDGLTIWIKASARGAGL